LALIFQLCDFAPTFSYEVVVCPMFEAPSNGARINGSKKQKIFPEWGKGPNYP
jgi:hypothetical protein